MVHFIVHFENSGNEHGNSKNSENGCGQNCPFWKYTMIFYFQGVSPNDLIQDESLRFRWQSDFQDLVGNLVVKHKISPENHES
jgi:hypothetical protein